MNRASGGCSFWMLFFFLPKKPAKTDFILNLILHILQLESEEEERGSIMSRLSGVEEIEDFSLKNRCTVGGSMSPPPVFPKAGCSAMGGGLNIRA
ncbi:MAG: hypothetical protein ACLUD2_15465 [Clostridium sp.]